jgi:disease resistance protein RPM1
MSLFQLKNAGIGGLESLQTLSEVIIDKDGMELIRELEKLRQLRKLSLVGIRKEHGSALCSLLNKMLHLEKLRVGSKSRFQFDYEVISLHLVSSPPMLQNLRPHGRLEKLPEWGSQPPKSC